VVSVTARRARTGRSSPHHVASSSPTAGRRPGFCARRGHRASGRNWTVVRRNVHRDRVTLPTTDRLVMSGRRSPPASPPRTRAGPVRDCVPARAVSWCGNSRVGGVCDPQVLGLGRVGRQRHRAPGFTLAPGVVVKVPDCGRSPNCTPFFSTRRLVLGFQFLAGSVTPGPPGSPAVEQMWSLPRRYRSVVRQSPRRLNCLVSSDSPRSDHEPCRWWVPRRSHRRPTASAAIWLAGCRGGCPRRQPSRWCGGPGAVPGLLSAHYVVGTACTSSPAAFHRFAMKAEPYALSSPRNLVASTRVRGTGVWRNTRLARCNATAHHAITVFVRRPGVCRP